MHHFSEARFPTDIAYGISGGPEYATEVVITVSGHEQRNANWQIGRGRYNLAGGIRTKIQLDQVIAFFRARKGRAIGFRFKDWTDYQATSQNLGIGDSLQKQFQLVKIYHSGKQSERRVIHKPVENTVSIYVDNIKLEQVIVDYTSGKCHFAAAPAEGAVITADFEFDLPVRFDTDRLSTVIENYGSYSWHDLPVVEIKL